MPQPQEQPWSQSLNRNGVAAPQPRVGDRLESKLAGGCDSIWSLEFVGVRAPHPMGVRVTEPGEKCPRTCPR